MSVLWIQEPPRSTRYVPDPGPTGSVCAPLEYPAVQSFTHSRTLPNMSCKPRAFAALPPTACVWLPELPLNHAIVPTVASSLLPLLNAVVVPARHAYSHSASLGNRMPVALR
jgi:hypothetical protein